MDGMGEVEDEREEMRNSRSSLEHAEYKSKSSKAGHTVIFLIVSLVTIFVANSFPGALWLIILNLLLNVYPIFVQRYNKPRYRRLLRKYRTEAV